MGEPASGDGTAEAAARRVAADQAIDLGPDVRLLPGVANTVLHFVGAGVVAKIAVRERFHEAVRREHAIAEELLAMAAPAPRPLTGTGAVADPSTGFVVTLWHHIPNDPAASPPEPECIAALDDLHRALDRTTTPVPSFVEELTLARRALDDDAFTAELSRSDRGVLAAAFDAGLSAVERWPIAVHRLHGEPHAAKRVVTAGGVVWVDLETCCTGPREWDLAFFDPSATAGRTDLDDGLLFCMRVLNAARFATWQSGLMGRYPHLRSPAAEHLAFVRQNHDRIDL